MRFFSSKYFVILVFLTSCSSLMYYPKSGMFYDPTQFRMLYENIYFNDGDGRKIHAWWFDCKTEPCKGTFVYFHGNAENLTSHFASLSWLPSQGYSYLIFDYPGYDESEGEPSPKDNVTAGIAAIKWVHDNKDKRPLIIYGQSMGGNVAMRSVIELKNQIPFQVLIADGTFSSFKRIARKKLSLSWITWILQPLAYVVLSDKWAPTVQEIAPVPLIVIHGQKDNVVEYEFGEKIFADANEPKVFIPVPEGHHGDLYWIEDGKYRKPLIDAIERFKR